MTQGQEFSLFFGGWRVPLDITLQGVDGQGRSVGMHRPEFNFQFRHRSVSFTVRFRDEQGQARLDISAQLGGFPFSAEAAEQRLALTAIIRAANQHLGQAFAVSKGKITLQKRLPTSSPVTAVGLVTAISSFLVPLKPYLDLISMVRMLPAGHRSAS